VSASITRGAARRSERVARRALGFALDANLSTVQAADLLGSLTASDATTLRLALARILRTSSGGPVNARAARALWLALQTAEDNTRDPTADDGEVHQADPRANARGIVLLGRPGAGKGTQGARIAELLGVLHISTGDLLRNLAEQETPLGFQAQVFMNSGRLVPDALVLELIDARLSQPDAQTHGFVLDGFPRTVPQAEALETIHPGHVHTVIELVIPPDVASARLRCRARTDDSIAATARRIEEYECETRPVLRWYEHRCTVVRLDGDRTVDAVTTELLDRLDRTGRRHLISDTSVRNADQRSASETRRTPGLPPEIPAAGP